MAFTGPIEDRLAIRELIESYASAVSERDAVAWARLWAEDSCWRLPDFGSGVSLQGKAEIVESWKRMMNEFHGPVERPWAFSFVSILGAIDVAGDRASVLSYSLEAFADAAGKTIHLKGRYRDVVVRQNGSWLFAERVWWLMPLDDHPNFSA